MSPAERFRLPQAPPLTATQRFWRSRYLARVRHGMGRARRPVAALTRAHARIIRWSGGRIRRSFLFTGGMPILVLTTTGRRTGRERSAPLGYVKVGSTFAVLASAAGSDHVPAWWLNLQADPLAQVLADGAHHTVRARVADEEEDALVWEQVAQLNPGFDEYRKLTRRRLPVVLLEVTG